jgi:hypothetical protein
MGGFIQPSPAPQQSDSNWRPILIGVGIVVVIVALIVLGLREEPKAPSGPVPYANNLKVSNLKMSAAENFVGATVSYIDGTVTNAGDKTVTAASARVIFKDEMGQTVGDQEVPLHVLEMSGPYPDTVYLTSSPLWPGQSKTFRLTFERISTQWNHQYPEIQIMDVATR